MIRVRYCNADAIWVKGRYPAASTSRDIHANEELEASIRGIAEEVAERCLDVGWGRITDVQGETVEAGKVSDRSIMTREAIVPHCHGIVNVLMCMVLRNIAKLSL